MRFDGNFSFVKQVDVTSLKKRISSFTEDEWHRMSWKERRGTEHRCTQTIPIFFDSDFRHTHPTPHPHLALINQDVANLTSLMRRFYLDPNGYFIRMIIVRMNPHSEIPLHYDTGSSLPYAHRLHLPIVTNSKVTFQVGEEHKNLPEGEIWEINNQNPHGVRNSSDIGRIHIIMDWVTEALTSLREQELGIPIEDVGVPPVADSRISR